MNLNDFMALAIVMVALGVVGVDIRLVIMFPAHRWILMPLGIAVAALGIVFLLNLLKIWVGVDGVSVPPIFGRFAVFLLLGTILSGGIYALRSKRPL